MRDETREETDDSPVGELPRLVIDLTGKLACRSEHQRNRVLLAATIRPARLTDIAVTWTTFVDLMEDRNEEGSSLARACLSAGHQVPLGEDDGNRVLLYWRGARVAAELNVITNDLAEL